MSERITEPLLIDATPMIDYLAGGSPWWRSDPNPFPRFRLWRWWPRARHARS